MRCLCKIVLMSLVLLIVCVIVLFGLNVALGDVELPFWALLLIGGLIGYVVVRVWDVR